MDLLIDGSHGQQSKTTIYGIYKVFELQEKFGLDVMKFETWNVELILTMKIN